jgi:hypothetical protein
MVCVVIQSEALDEMEWETMMEAAAIEFQSLGKRLQAVDQQKERERLDRLRRRTDDQSQEVLSRSRIEQASDMQQKVVEIEPEKGIVCFAIIFG